jgi:hypothetical protein
MQLNPERLIAVFPFLFWLIAFLVVLALWGVSLVWLYRDARQRGRPALVLVLVVGLLNWPWGLPVYWLARPVGPPKPGGS